jgi:hypothetical protein
MLDETVSMVVDQDGRRCVEVRTGWAQQYEIATLFREIARSYNTAMTSPDLVEIPASAATMSLDHFVELGQYLADVRVTRERLKDDTDLPEVQTGDRVRATWRGRRLVALAVPPGWSSRTPADRISDEVTVVLSDPPPDPQRESRASFARAVNRLREFGESHG